MEASAIETFDPTLYESAPLLTADVTLELLRDLAHAQPPNPPRYVVRAAARMAATATALAQALIARVVDTGLDTTMEHRFDVACERFWNDTRNWLEHLIHYEDDTLDLLGPEACDELALDEKRQRAAVARELYQRLFGGEGAQRMESLLTFMRSSDSASNYIDALGLELVKTLELIQGRHDELLSQRSHRSGRIAKLRELRFAAQRDIASYARAVLTMLDDDGPGSSATVMAALQPIAHARLGAKPAHSRP